MKALNLMNECATAILSSQHFPDIVLLWFYECSFIATNCYGRRASKLYSIIAFAFTSVYITKWLTFFSEKDLRYAPTFRSRVICCGFVEGHLYNQYDTCLRQWIKSGKLEKEAKETLDGSLKGDKNKLLYQLFIKYEKDIPTIFRLGTCVFKAEVEIITENKDCHVKINPRPITVHSENIASSSFWNEKLYLVKKLGQFNEDLNIRKLEAVFKCFQSESMLALSTWIVIQIDGCNFNSRFTEEHEFEKPSDAQAANLMNLCAAFIMEEFKDIVFAYGFSDEYSLVLNKDSQLYERHARPYQQSEQYLFLDACEVRKEQACSTKGHGGYSS